MADEQEPAVEIPVEAPVPPVDANKVEVEPSIDPGVKLTKYSLTHDGDSAEIEACDELAARAMFNDRRKKWPSPHEVSVTVVQ